MHGKEEENDQEAVVYYLLPSKGIQILLPAIKNKFFACQVHIMKLIVQNVKYFYKISKLFESSCLC